MIKSNLKFNFGKNWLSYIELINKKKILIAEKSIKNITNKKRIKFIDVGCGSGLFSLAACNLGFNVTSIDIDQDSIACAKFLKKKFNKKKWTIKKGSILDQKFMKGLSKFDLIYCWGVVHHTGNMWLAIKNLDFLIKKGSVICIAIYNEQNIKSKIWLIMKIIYNKLPFFLREIYLYLIISLVMFYSILKIIFFIKPKKNINLRQSLINLIKRRRRGMTFFVNWRDWLGGYPYEYCTEKKIKDYFMKKKFKFLNSKITNGHGCNEFIFKKY